MSVHHIASIDWPRQLAAIRQASSAWCRILHENGRVEIQLLRDELVATEVAFKEEFSLSLHKAKYNILILDITHEMWL